MLKKTVQSLYIPFLLELTNNNVRFCLPSKRDLKSTFTYCNVQCNEHETSLK